VSTVQVKRADGTTFKATGQREVEDTICIWNEIHGKRFYIAEQAPICQGKLRGDFGYMASNEAGRAILDERYQCPEGTDEGTIDLFQEIAHIRSIVPKDLVNTSFTRQRWVGH
jgi:hypothetical protein